MTNYLSKFVLMNRLLEDGTIPNNVYGRREATQRQPRIIIVSSDSHQGASAIDWQEFGQLKPFGVNGAINNYSYFKLILNTWAVELSRRLAPEGRVDVPVHVMCPGPVNTNIIREAPWALRGVLKVIFTFFFRSPEAAAKPLVYMAAHDDFAGVTGRYLHMFRPKEMDPKCYDSAQGERIWAQSLVVLDQAAQGESRLAG